MQESRPPGVWGGGGVRAYQIPSRKLIKIGYLQSPPHH